MVNGAPVIAYECPYNRETTAGHALWFDNRHTTAGELMAKIERDETTEVRATAGQDQGHEPIPVVRGGPCLRAAPHQVELP